jgi:predicted DNA-binding protein (UPF0251 family)
MGRCKKQRNISQNVDCTLFKPAWIGRRKIPEIELMMDEIEAINLADVEWWDMKASAEKMWISAPTFCRVLESGRKKMWTAILHGYAIKICPCQKRDKLTSQ